MTLNDLLQRRFAILGLGSEGRALVAALKSIAPEMPLRVFCEQAPLPDHGLDLNRDQLVVAPFDPQQLGRFEVLVKSPGVSRYHPALPVHVEVTSSTNLWFAQRSGQRVLCITGTKGKSTVAALTAHILRSAGLNVELVGNIGVPAIARWNAGADFWVMELSSYQLADLQAQPELGVVLSLFPEHIDWHGSLEYYWRDKLRLLALARHAWAPAALRQQIATHAPPELDLERVQWLPAAGQVHPGAQGLYRDQRLILSGTALPLRGAHNAHNIAIAWELAAYAGLDEAQIRQHLKGFQSLPHRLNELPPAGGRRFVDDSISTTPHASIAALQAYRDDTVTLLVGGYDRGVSWKEFAYYLAEHPIYSLVCMGEHGASIAGQLRRCDIHLAGGIYQAAELSAAVQLARQHTPAGGVVMLSPGAPSYGEFIDYRARGKAFAKYALD